MAGETINISFLTEWGWKGWGCTIDAQGNIPVGALGSVHVAGLSPHEAAKHIERMVLEQTAPRRDLLRVEVSR